MNYFIIHIFSILLMSHTIIYPTIYKDLRDLKEKKSTIKFPGESRKIRESIFFNFSIKEYKEYIVPLILTAGMLEIMLISYFNPIQSPIKAPIQAPSKEIYYLRGTQEKLYQIKKEDSDQDAIEKIHNLIHQYQAMKNNNQSWININETENHTIKKIEKIAE
ncbi:MAG: hypothetical protein ACXWL5_00125 [Candidatus Chromulinivorax sp.]